MERAYSNVGSGNEQLLKAAEYQVDALSCVCVGNLNECMCFIFLPERCHECVVITLSFSEVHLCTCVCGLGNSASADRLGLCHKHTGTSKSTETALKCCYALHRSLGTFNSHVGSVDNSIHSPKVGIRPPKTVCGCPCGGVTKNGHTGSPPTYGMLLSVCGC